MRWWIVLTGLALGLTGFGLWFILWWLAFPPPHSTTLLWNRWYEWIPEGVILGTTFVAIVIAMIAHAEVDRWIKKR